MVPLAHAVWSWHHQEPHKGLRDEGQMGMSLQEEVSGETGMAGELKVGMMEKSLPWAPRSTREVLSILSPQRSQVPVCQDQAPLCVRLWEASRPAL